MIKILFLINNSFYEGIEFGDEKVRNWLISLIISFLTGILLTQPLKVILVTLFCVALLRKYDDDTQNMENNPNKIQNAHDSKNVNKRCLLFVFYFRNFKLR